MRLVSFLSLIAAISGASLAKAAPSPDDALAQAVAELSEKGCYGIASGAVSVPSAQDQNAVENSIKAVEGMGLSYGVSDSMMKALGAPGLMLVAQATMGSKALQQGDLVLAVGGRQPGCRVILLAEPSVNVTDAVSSRLSQSGWKAAPGMTIANGQVERRAFVRRDDRGRPYLTNIITITTSAPDSKLRMFTTTVRIPDGVQLPTGF